MKYKKIKKVRTSDLSWKHILPKPSN
jgi:hypothetical protein